MKLTFDEAINEHRKMWNWIAHETEIRKHRVYKDEYFLEEKVLKELPCCSCFCCEYGKEITKKLRVDQFQSSRCKYCPIIWGGDSDMDIHCEDNSNPYQYYVDTLYNDWENLARLARQIANLPVREKREEDI